ncbi:MAG: putative methyltransferase YcgJ [Firmicutes bacterium ADurb.Bin354]|nr:MAG: putative methyltransferase YcgJ [Firmicutes bacterium ADurb.Bin354]
MEKKESLLPEIRDYWTKRAPSYSDFVNSEFADEGESRFAAVIEEQIKMAEEKSGRKYKKVLDIGTGPGFFAILLAKRGYEVTAVDFTQAMLDEASGNADRQGVSIEFKQMDAQTLELPDDLFDLIVTRNVTWNLENPAKAYCDWHRVLRKGGILLNFDAGWYNYLFDSEAKEAFEADHENVIKLGVPDLNQYSDGIKMEEISKSLIMSRESRPDADLRMMREAGFDATADREIWRRVWSKDEQINWASTPMFMLAGYKRQ